MSNTIKIFVLLIFSAFVFGCTSTGDEKKNTDEQAKQTPLVEVAKVKNAVASNIEIEENTCIGMDNCVQIDGNGSPEYEFCFEVVNPSAKTPVTLISSTVIIPASGTAVENTCLDSTPLNQQIAPGGQTTVNLPYCMSSDYTFTATEKIGFNIQLSIAGVIRDTIIKMPVCITN